MIAQSVPEVKLPAEVDTQISGADNKIGAWQDRDRRSFKHAQEIIKPWGGLEPVLDWCKQELVADWRWQMVEMSTDQRPGRYIFYFDDERDCLAFILKWR
jgi:hypothetical protein